MRQIQLKNPISKHPKLRPNPEKTYYRNRFGTRISNSNTITAKGCWPMA